MAGMPTINIGGPIASVQALDTDSAGCTGRTGGTAQENLLLELEAQKAQLAQTLEAVQNTANQLNDYQNKIIVEHREAIAKLAVEIARKILVQKVRDKDYEIESIVKEALTSAPTRQNVVARLNPEDLGQLQKLQGEKTNAVFDGVKFVADPGIGQGECVLETPKGIIESLINDHLEQISRALTKAV